MAKLRGFSAERGVIVKVDEILDTENAEEQRSTEKIFF